jgi:hypothetical protein
MKKRIQSLDEYTNGISESFFSNMSVGEVQRIKNWLDEVGIKRYTINKDLTVDVDGIVFLGEMTFEKLPIRFGKVSEWFSVAKCKNLKSLEGCPEKVSGSFWCNDCLNLKSLEGCPVEVSRDFWCHNCGKDFTKDEVRKLCKVRHTVYT